MMTNSGRPSHMQNRLLGNEGSNPDRARTDEVLHFAASRRITAADAEHRDEVLGSILALAAVALLTMAILASSYMAPEQRPQLFQTRPTFAAP